MNQPMKNTGGKIGGGGLWGQPPFPPPQEKFGDSVHQGISVDDITNAA